MKTIDIHGRPYTPVNERINWVRDNLPNASIVTTLLTNWNDPEVWVKAVFTPDVTNPNRFFTGHAQSEWITGEKKVNKFGKEIDEVDRTAALENAETSAIGRCLGAAGIGTETSVASADELKKALLANGRTDRLKDLTSKRDNVAVSPPKNIDVTGIPHCELCQKEIDSSVRNYSMDKFNNHQLCYSCQVKVRKNPKLVKADEDRTDEGRELDRQREEEAMNAHFEREILNA